MRSLTSRFSWRKNNKLNNHDEKPKLIESTPGGLRLLLISIGLLTLTALPHFGHLRIEIMIVFLALVGYRCLAAKYRNLPRNRWVIYLSATIGFSISAWFYGPPFGRDPGVAFLVVLLGLKSLEITSRRDVSIVIMLGFFTIMTQFLYADGVSWTIPMIILVGGLMWLLAQMEHAEPQTFMLGDIKLVGKMFLQALPVVVILFYLFPRLSGSLFLFQGDGNSGVTGLGDSLKMGSISSLVESEEVAFVASFFDQEPPPPSERYWRGTNFWVTDGREWSRGGHGVHLISKERTIVEKKYTYEIELQPNNQNWLFALDHPGQAPKNAWLQGDHHIINKEPVKSEIRYELDAVSFDDSEQLLAAEERLGLDLGKTEITPRLQKLVDSFTDQAPSSIAIANRALQYFNQNEFVYSLSPPLLDSNAPVDEFMFESQTGFCGHYASSFATMMRQADIPARIVVGYLGGDYNPRSNQIVVRQSHAHAWTEIWQEGQGWIRVDPTAAVAPERIESSIDLNGSTGNNGQVLFSSLNLTGFKKFITEAIWIKDSIKAKWNRWFINFDRDRQQELLRSLGLGNLDFRYITIFAFLLALTIITMVSLLIFRREKKPLDATTQLSLLFDKKMMSMGLARGKSEGPRDFQLRAVKAFPSQKSELKDISNQLIRLRYRMQGSSEEVSHRADTNQLVQLKKAIKSLNIKP